ncbi:hypothetical protein GGTG_11524 [Gaeumannomyces tritici R3-111a-1]|uniref:Uncharacterized protein n=1 Tax=Gaeumannomyces tritici (strain R3-111a-1) TaxID=644352 RepID=J3PDF3_GAET3|nr:hypothetical protein GGTG_11524 [Gaeumannomyces tritici R3-111a-1]EJT70501.1 hypothetical protein GGTG_11524 [Gaeumannomyces tritici R3-111a-1]
MQPPSSRLLGLVSLLLLLGGAFPGNAATYSKTPAGGNSGMRTDRLQDLDMAGRDPVTGAARARDEKITAGVNNPNRDTDTAIRATDARESGVNTAKDFPDLQGGPSQSQQLKEHKKTRPNTETHRRSTMEVYGQSPPPPAQFGKGTRPTHPLWDAQPNADGRINDPATGQPYTAGQPERPVFPAKKQTGRFKGGDENGPNRETVGIHPPAEKDSLTRYPQRPPVKLLALVARI